MTLYLWLLSNCLDEEPNELTFKVARSLRENIGFLGHLRIIKIVDGR